MLGRFIERIGGVSALPVPTPLVALLPLLLAAFAACGPAAGVVRFDDIPACPEAAPTGPETLPPAPARHDLECALATLRQVMIPTPEQDLVASRAAGELAAGEPDIKVAEKLAGEGQWWAERALFHMPNDPVALYWFSVSLGQLLVRHPLKALKNLPKLERSLKRAAAAVPDLDQGGPLRVLGMLYVKAPAWPQGIGDTDKGLELLQKAVERHPEHPMNAFFLARAQWDVDGDSARGEVADRIVVARNALATRDWGWVADRWARDIDQLAKDAGLAKAPGPPASGDPKPVR